MLHAAALERHDIDRGTRLPGQLYETFFWFTGGNTIGQYFTPRHIARFMADLCEVSSKDKVLDPACGTGGFLIAPLYKMIGDTNPTRKELAALVRKHLVGFETEPVTAALCVANMILRGDGATGIVKGDCFTSDQYPVGRMTVVLGNPPFPHARRTSVQKSSLTVDWSRS